MFAKLDVSVFYRVVVLGCLGAVHFIYELFSKLQKNMPLYYFKENWCF